MRFQLKEYPIAINVPIMTRHHITGLIVLLILIKGMTSCGPSIKKHNDYLISFNDTIKDQWGYKNQKGEIVIPSGKYARCFTDTFKTYAIR